MSGENVLHQCPICSKKFENTGNRIPLLLPCSHTFCKRCIELVQSKKTVKCYVCGKFLPIPEGSEEFPINKYILPHIRKENYDMCTKHGKVAIFFCKEVQCGNGICGTCVVKEHKTHDFVEMADEKKRLLAVLVRRADTLGKELERRRENFLKVKEVVWNKNACCLAGLEVSKTETLRKIIKKFDEKINFVAYYKNKMDKKIQGEIESLEHRLDFLTKAKDTDSTMARRDISLMLSEVQLWAKEAEKDLYEYYIYDKNPADEAADRLCGNINPQKNSVYKDTTIIPSQISGNDSQRETNAIRNKMITPKRPSQTRTGCGPALLWSN